MAYSTFLKSQRMINLAGTALGKLMATAIVANQAATENLQMTGTPAAYLPTGILDAAITAAANIDLSDAAVCAEAGMVIPDGLEVAIFVITDGTNTLARVGTAKTVTSRSTVEGALTSTTDYLTYPDDIDAGLYICAGYVTFTVDESTTGFIVGKPGDAGGDIDQQTSPVYYQTTNLLPGTKVAL